MGESNIKELITKKGAKDKKLLVNVYETIKLAIFVLLTVFVIFMLPFIYPILSNVLVKWNVIEGIEQLEKYVYLFRGFNILIIIGFIIFIIHESSIHFSDIFSNIFNRDFAIKIGDKQFEIKLSELWLEHIGETVKMSSEIRETAKTVFLDKSNTAIKMACDECRKEETEAERESLRYFAAYKITDSCSRALLLYIKNNGEIYISDFKNNMEKYYQKTRGMGKKRRQEKVESLLYDLKYINIIEYTEDDVYIILTQNGKEFIENFYRREIG